MMASNLLSQSNDCQSFEKQDLEIITITAIFVVVLVVIMFFENPVASDLLE